MNLGFRRLIFFEKCLGGDIVLFLILPVLVKRAQIPFRIWLPIAMVAPTPISALVHSSTLVTAGFYLMFRFNGFCFYLDFMMGMMFVIIFTLIFSVVEASIFMDLKKVVAFSTINHISLILLFLFMGLKDLSFLHMIIHAIFKSLLFLIVGVFIIKIWGEQELSFYNL
jgi:NADH-ubiquinone oxidoreductase chain 5